MNSPGRVLVLGGTGFIGGHLCTAFAQAGDDVLAVASGPVTAPPVPLLALDLLELAVPDLTALLITERATAVVNATGAVWGATDEDMTAVHAVLVERLVAAAADVPWRPRLIQLGSMYEYGPVPQGRPVDEATDTRPVSWYGSTKLRGSRAVLAASRQGRVNGLVLRVSNTIGPGVPRDSLLGRTCEQLLAAGGDGPAVLHFTPLQDERDFVDISDVVRAVRAAVAAPVSGQVLNIGGGRVVGVRRLVEMLIAVSGIAAHVVETAPPDEESRAVRSVGLGWVQADISAARRLLGWAPQRPLEESLHAIWHAAAIGAARRASTRPSTPAPGTVAAMNDGR
ncbi:NAD(P)-dependent oxidoreductase [Actinomadura sp. ATCC 31491]|uniref:NAD(P)-dependent oxidoreductase n=1 Tax=Actinomadura luzonensis TaxID=2805427 RepID=A0ABT0G914_9ACTN|nr:NAD(P)-dependent oxidoreductase [Actinomadura luzonensis]MCK2221090.1 NAD(P)-dependent oxidoreductase [Actinomadura luzonensis]